MWNRSSVEYQFRDIVCNRNKFTILVIPNPCTGQTEWFLYQCGRELQRGQKSSILAAGAAAERMAEVMGALFN